MKKSKKFILAVIILLLIGIGLIMANPDWVDSKEKVEIEVSKDVKETREELEDEIFD